MTYSIFDYINGKDIKSFPIEDHRLRSLLILNLGSFFLLGMSLFFALGFIYFNIKSLAAFNIIQAFSALSILFFARKFYEVLFKILFVLVLNFQIVLYSSILGPESMIQTFLILSIGWIYLIFEGEHRLFRIFGFAMSIFSFVALETLDYRLFKPIDFSPNFYDLIKWSILLSSLIFNWLIIRAFYRNKESYEHRTKTLIQRYEVLNQELIEREERIQKQANAYKLLSDNSGDIIGLHDRSFVFSFISPSIKHQLGMEESAFLEMDFLDLVHPKFRKKLNRDAYFSDLKHNDSALVQLQLKHADGTFHWFELLAQLRNDPDEMEKDTIQVTFRNINEQKRLESILQDAQKMAKLGGWEYDVHNQAFYWTDQVRAIHEVSDSWVPNLENEITFFEAEQRPKIRKAFEDASRVGKSFDVEVPFITGNGKRKFVRYLGKPINAQGKVTRVLGLIQDITDRKETEIEIINSKERAEAATRAKSDFLSIMSHEIRTPMNAVIGFTHLLLQENPAPSQIENLKALRFSANHLLALIYDILDFSKIESGKIEFDQVEFNLNETLNGIYHALNVKAEEKDVKLILEKDTNIDHRIIGDEVRLNQVLINIIGNAIEFTENGNVTISSSLKHSPNPNSDQIQIHFSVKDTGVGIDERQIRSVFDQFSQESTATTRKFGGTGLGLAICKNLVELQGGEIWVESEKGIGSTFHFVLPFQKGKLTKATRDFEKENSDVEIDLTGLKVLLVEDNPVNQLIAKKFLSQWQLEITVAEDGLKALSAVKKEAFDIILMDLQMPEMDGYEASIKIRKLPTEHAKKVPIIALSAAAFIEVREDVKSAGMDDYLSKPFNPDELFAKIMRYTKSRENASK